MVDLNQAKNALEHWIKENGLSFRYFRIAETARHWCFSPCGPAGEMLFVSRSITISKETGEISLYFPPDHPEDNEPWKRVEAEPYSI